MNVLSLRFLSVIFKVLPLSLPLGLPPSPAQAEEGRWSARQAFTDSRRIVGITETAQATSIHLIVTGGVQACQYSRVIFVSENLQRNMT